MPLFQIKNSGVVQVPIDLLHFKNEAELRDFFADNLDSLLGLRVLAIEYPTRDGRIDTLAIDETGAPVIIEYKWNEKDNILPQGLFYFDWLKENKSLFELLVANKLGKEVKVSWDRPRVVLVAQGFDRYTVSAVRQVKNVELIKYTPYSSDILFLEVVYSPDTVKPVAETIGRKGNMSYGVEYHLKRVSQEVRETFYTLQEEIRGWANVEEMADQKAGITYRTTKSFTRFEFGRSYIDVLVRDSRYGHKIDSKGMVKDISSFKWGYNGRIKIKSRGEISYVLDIIRQSYESTL